MKKLTFLLIFAFLAIALANCTQTSKAETSTTSTTLLSDEALIEKGKYLSTVIGCDHCHTPKKMTPQGPVPDLDRWMMGYPAGDPLPEIDTSEITPGKWALFNGDLTAAVGPWGISYSANLTSDETGVGSWTFEQFKRAMVEGKYRGLENSRPLMPPMPWQSYRNMKDEDLKAIFAYLQSVKPIANVVPSYVPPNEIK